MAAKSGAERSFFGAAAIRVQRAWGESPFYQAKLRGPAPDRLLHAPVDPLTPDRALGQAVLNGAFSFGVASVDSRGDLGGLWSAAPQSGRLYEFLQEFAWLRHVDALGAAAESSSRALLAAWLDRYEKWAPDAWEPALTAERLVNLCCNSALILKNADALWRSRVLSSMARQTRHLANVGHRAQSSWRRLTTASGLSLAGLCLPGCEEPAERGLELLRRELRLQLRPDGGHASRNPSLQLRLVIRLQMILKALDGRRLPTPPFLKHAAVRAAATVQFFRSGDGRLAVFNGGGEDDGRAVVAALQALDPGTPTGFARHIGFQRLEAGRSLLIADVGETGSQQAFDGVSSFHFSSGRSRIIGNCGDGSLVSEDWRKALLQAAAHSTVSTEVVGGVSPFPAALAISHRRSEHAHGQLLEIERAFGDRDGPRHIRRLYLSPSGDNLRGEDAFIALPTMLATGWRIRFHLHPTVKASVARDGKSVILALENYEGWRFRSNAPGLRLERSVYCGEDGALSATEQLVLGAFGLEAPVGGDIVVKWAVQRLEAAGAGAAPE